MTTQPIPVPTARNFDDYFNTKLPEEALTNSIFGRYPSPLPLLPSATPTTTTPIRPPPPLVGAVVTRSTTTPVVGSPPLLHSVPDFFSADNDVVKWIVAFVVCAVFFGSLFYAATFFFGVSIDRNGGVGSPSQYDEENLKKLVLQLLEDLSLTPPPSSSELEGIIITLENLKNEVSSLPKHNNLQGLGSQLVTMQNQIKEIKENTPDKVDMTKLTEKFNRFSSEVESIVDSKINLFNAGGIAKPDYAHGGSIVSVNQAPYYQTTRSLSSWLSLPSLFKKNYINPEFELAQTILQTDVSPGSCWAFLGENANVTVHLICPVSISEVSLDHADFRILPSGNGSVPKRFQVWGTKYNHISQIYEYITLLVDDEFKLNKGTVQTFPVTDFDTDSGGSAAVWEYVTLVILSNHNDKKDQFVDFTCVYRFRVHSDNGCLRRNTIEELGKQ